MNIKTYLKTYLVSFTSGWLIATPLVLAQGLKVQKPNGSNRPSLQTIVFKPPKDSMPRLTNGAATRDGSTCLSDSAQVGKLTKPILPQNHFGLTLANRPEFLINKTNSSTKQIFFSLKQENGEQIYQTFLPLPAETGIVGINMPADAPELIANQKYKWTMAFICGAALRPDSPTISGWIQRIPKSSIVAAKLQKASPLEQIALYGEMGIWYDMVSALNKLRNSNSGEISGVWQKLLNENGMKEVETIPFSK
jgi:Domain of Unknown Function (DUF928)